MKYRPIAVATLATLYITLLPGCDGGKLEIGQDTSEISNGGSASCSPTMNVVEGYGYVSVNAAIQCPATYLTSDSNSNSNIPVVTSIQDINGTLDSDGTCEVYCQSDCDCPTPDTGTASPKCSDEVTFIGADVCVLSCDNGEICPDGMTCLDTIYGHPTCIWHTPAAENVWEDPSLCGKLTTREDCENLLSSEPVAQTYHCAWARELALPQLGSTCGDSAPVERCVAVQATQFADPTCVTYSYDSTTPAPVFWSNTVADDYDLITLETCDVMPYTGGLSYSYQACDFSSGTGSPSACGCASAFP